MHTLMARRTSTSMYHTSEACVKLTVVFRICYTYILQFCISVFRIPYSYAYIVFLNTYMHVIGFCAGSCHPICVSTCRSGVSPLQFVVSRPECVFPWFEEWSQVFEDPVVVHHFVSPLHCRYPFLHFFSLFHFILLNRVCFCCRCHIFGAVMMMVPFTIMVL